MNIIGPDALAFGVDDVGACRDYLTAFGLKPIDVDETGGFFEALDGTGVLIRRRDDPRLPAPLETADDAAPDRSTASPTRRRSTRSATNSRGTGR